MTATDYDLLIIGGGLVGASLACALDGLGLRIGLVEAAPLTAPTTDDVAATVRDWCITAPTGLRIVLCGYDTEHDALLDHGWSVVEGKAGRGAGYSTRADNGRRERLWLSPACHSPHQPSLDFRSPA